MDKKKEIGERIRKFRIRAGYTNHEIFAYEINLPRKTMWRAETGENITIDTLIRISEGLNIPLEEFFRGI